MKILLYTDLAIGPDQLFWHRDLGLLTKAFRDLGHDAWLVVHPSTESIRHPPLVTPQDPVIWVSPSDVRNPSWWQSHQPDLVILGLWTRPQYDSIRQAALSATPRVIERADSDGMRTASCGLRTYARRRYDYFRGHTDQWPAALSSLASAIYSFLSILGTPWLEFRLAQTLRLLPVILVETPHAAALWRTLSVKLRIDPDRIHCVPHPIQTDIFRLDPDIRQKNQLISVGRWDSYQKNFPLLLRTLENFLHRNPDWTALVVGPGLPHSSSHPRMGFSRPLPARELALRMQESRIFLCTSRYESFGLAAAEAKACGCQVVAPRDCFLAAPSLRPAPGESLAKALDRCRTLPPSGLSPSSGMEWAPQRIAEQILHLPFPPKHPSFFGAGRSMESQGYNASP